MSEHDSQYALETAHLSRADEHLRQGRQLVAQQLALIQRLTLAGKPTEDAERVLEAMRYAQTLMQQHRTITLGVLAWLAEQQREGQPFAPDNTRTVTGRRSGPTPTLPGRPTRARGRSSARLLR
jgi:hypothetical protein